MAIQGEINRKAEAETQQFLTEHRAVLREVCLRLAIEAKATHHTTPSVPSAKDHAEMILGMARAFEAYVSGQEAEGES